MISKIIGHYFGLFSNRCTLFVNIKNYYDKVQGSFLVRVQGYKRAYFSIWKVMNGKEIMYQGVRERLVDFVNMHGALFPFFINKKTNYFT